MAEKTQEGGLGLSVRVVGCMSGLRLPILRFFHNHMVPLFFPTSPHAGHRKRRDALWLSIIGMPRSFYYGPWYLKASQSLLTASQPRCRDLNDLAFSIAQNQAYGEVRTTRSRHINVAKPSVGEESHETKILQPYNCALRGYRPQ